jgi:hypothetical protein
LNANVNNYRKVVEDSTASDLQLDSFTANDRETESFSGVGSADNCPDFDFDMSCVDICETVTINSTSPEPLPTHNDTVRKVIFKDTDTSHMPPPMSINIQKRGIVPNPPTPCSGPLKIRKPFSISAFSGSSPINKTKPLKTSTLLCPIPTKKTRASSTTTLSPPHPRGKTKAFLPPLKKRRHERSVVKQPNSGLLITSAVTQSDIAMTPAKPQLAPPIFSSVSSTTTNNIPKSHPIFPLVSSSTNAPSPLKKQKYPTFPSIASFLSAVRNASIDDLAFQPDLTPPAPVPPPDAHFLPPDIHKTIDIHHPVDIVDLTPDDI